MRVTLQDEAFETLLTGFTRSAFRLETLPQYLVESEAAAFAAYSQGELLPPPRSEEETWWDNLVRRHSAAGHSFERVHVLPAVLTPYLRFEIEWGYAFTAAAGELISFLPSSAPDALRSKANSDFWLFDEQTLVYPNYDCDGRFLRLELENDPRCVMEAIRLKGDLLAHAVPLKAIVRELRGLE